MNTIAWKADPGFPDGTTPKVFMQDTDLCN